MVVTASVKDHCDLQRSRTRHVQPSVTLASPLMLRKFED
jgi:hypothetical protein